MLIAPSDTEGLRGAKEPVIHAASGALHIGGGGWWDGELLVGGCGAGAAEGVRGDAESVLLSAAAAARPCLLAHACQQEIERVCKAAKRLVHAHDLCVCVCMGGGDFITFFMLNAENIIHLAFL